MNQKNSNDLDTTDGEQEELIYRSTIEIVAKRPIGFSETSNPQETIVLTETDNQAINVDEMPQGKSFLFVIKEGEPICRLTRVPDKTTYIVKVDGNRIYEFVDLYPDRISRSEYIASNWQELAIESILLGISIADSLNDLCDGCEAEAADRLETHMLKALRRAKMSIHLTSQHKNALKRAHILLYYERLCKICKGVKKLHDRSYDEYCSSSRNRTRKEWKSRWSKIATATYPELEGNLFNYFSREGKLSVAQVARAYLAARYGYSESYLEKLLIKARKEVKKLPGWLCT
jgi:hypothetical protein